MHHWMSKLFTALTLVSLLLGAMVMPDAAKAEFVKHHRMVKLFDFEEVDDRGIKLGRGFDLPPHWYVIGQDALVLDANFNRQPLHQELMSRDGFPTFTEVGYSETQVTHGNYSLRLGLDSGQAGAFLELGTVGAVPGSDYLVDLRMQTRSLERAKVAVVAYFIDAQGRKIEDSEQIQDDLTSEGEWTNVQLKLTGFYDNAAWIGIELMLLQPTEDPYDALGNQQVVLQEVTGEAWFDDIAIWQLPHVEVGTQNMVNIHRYPQQPELRMLVRDLAGSVLIADVAVYDHEMNRVAWERTPVGGAAPTQWRWTPTLPKFGWYLVNMQIFDLSLSTDTPITRTANAFLWLPSLPSSLPESLENFSLIAEDRPVRELDLLPEIIEQIGLRGAVVSAWEEESTLRRIEQRAQVIDGLVSEITGQGRSLTISLYPLPREMIRASGIDVQDPLSVLIERSDAMLPYLEPLLRRGGQRISAWQMGSTNEPLAYLQGDDLANAVDLVHAELRRLVPEPQYRVMAKASHVRDWTLASYGALAVELSGTPRAEQLEQYLADILGKDLNWSGYLSPPSAETMTQERRVADTLLRMVYAWNHQPRGLAIDSPWAKAAERANAIVPDATLGAFMTGAHQLTDRTLAATLPLEEGLRGFVYKANDSELGGLYRDGKGVMVAWNEFASTINSQLNMYLGDSIVTVDPWGNRQRIEMIDGKHQIPLTMTPLFIEGVNVKLAEFRAGFAITNPFIDATQGFHQRTITVTNPWPFTITGSMQIVGPEPWTIQPAQHVFSIRGGDSQTFDIRLAIPVSELAGKKMFIAKFDLSADQRYRIDVAIPVEVGLTDVEFDAQLAIERNDDGKIDVIAVCTITNTGETRQALNAFARVPGQASIERPIAKLEPNQTVVKRFRFKDGLQDVLAGSVRVGVREMRGPAILNKRLTLGQ